MKDITLDDLRSSFHSEMYAKALTHWNKKHISDYLEKQSDDGYHITCRILTPYPYDVEVHLVQNGSDRFSVRPKCGCDLGRDNCMCQHVVAALVAHCKVAARPKNYPKFKIERVVTSSRAARSLLEIMRRSAQDVPGSTPLTAGLARMEAVIERAPYADGFEVGFRVGINRMYVIRDLTDFVEHIEKGDTFTYGKNLTLRHDLSAFDEPAQRAIRIIRDEVKAYQRTVARMGHYFYGSSSIRDKLALSPEAFLDNFDLIAALNPQWRGLGDAELADGDPILTMALEREGDRIALKVMDAVPPYDFMDALSAYLVVHGNRILRSTQDYYRAMKPFLTALGGDIVFSNEDMPAFCSLVLDRIRPYVQIRDPGHLIERYAPETCETRFYFDMEDEVLTCRVVFHYDRQDVPLGAQTQGIRRNALQEAAAEALVSGAFHKIHPLGDTFAMNDENDPIEFLLTGLEDFRAAGEVYLSDRIKQKQVYRPKASAGLSVSDGLLTLQLDTGGFPPEELEELYQSLLKRRRYYRLRDGRFMALENDGSGIEAVAEAAHMTMLSPKELKSGVVKMPAYRSLYMDSVFDRKDDLRVNRDKRFRDMVRAFKTVDDSDYQLPDGISGELRPYQETGYRWFKTLESCGFGGILADEMGLGKTLQTIVYFASRPRSETGKPHLVVCPASLVLNWADEIARFAPNLKVRLILGALAQRKALLSQPDDADVWVTSYDLLKRDMALYEGKSFYSCVLDEGQFVKNQSTKASKAVKSIVCNQRFVLTGTPIENRLSELWNLFDFLMPGYLFTHQRFMEKLEKPIVKQDDAQARSQLARLVRPFLLRRLKKDVLKELPDKIEHDRRIALSESERKVYHAQSIAALTQLQGSTEKMAILAALMRLRQICCDPNLAFENYEGETSKLEACLELIETMAENGHQILLFSQFTSMLDRIRGELDARGITSFTLQGSTPKQERARLVKAFNEGGAQVFLISLKAGGTGLNLTAADVVIHYDPWWNVAAQNQATDRAHRIGQRNCVQVYRLIAENTVEERIVELQKRKQTLLDSVTEGADEGIMKMSPDELMALMKEA